MKVRAKQQGFHVTIREPGAEFDMDGPVPSWCEPVGKVEPAPAGNPGQAAQGTQPIQPTHPEAAEAYHVGGGRYGIKDASGDRIGEFVGTKEEAEAEAIRLNAGDPDLTDQDNGLPDA